MRRIMHAAVAALGITVLAGTAGAQALGPQRQFLAIEPYYEHVSLDGGEGQEKVKLHGGGARLWINLAPFHFIPHSSIALFGSYAPKQNQSENGNLRTRQLGVEYNQFFVGRPVGGIVDPFLAVGYSRFRVFGNGQNTSYSAVPIGGGIRLPFPNRFQVRGDVKDLIIFNTPSGPAGANRTTHNLMFQAGLGLTF